MKLPTTEAFEELVVELWDTLRHYGSGLGAKTVEASFAKDGKRYTVNLTCEHDPEYDPTPFCAGCGSMTEAGCDCGPRADNE